MPIKVNGSTSGSVTLAAPTSGSDVTVTLPGAAGTVALASALGKQIIQVVSASVTAETSLVGTTTWTDTNLSASITPSATTSRVLVIASHPYLVHRNPSTEAAGGLRVLRGSTDISGGNNYNISVGGASGNISTRARWTITLLDSPASTSSLTYKTQFICNSSNDRFYLQEAGTAGAGTMILVEIGA